MKKYKYLIGAVVFFLTFGFVQYKRKQQIDEIFLIEDHEDFIIHMSEYISYKGDEDIDSLNKYQRLFYVNQYVEMEINNGGFAQFFYNSSGDFTYEMVESFEIIGAHHIASLCQKAIDAFGNEDLTDRAYRQELLENEHILEKLDALDDEFYTYPDDLNELNYQFIQKHIDDFKQ